MIDSGKRDTLFEAVFENAPLGIAIADVQGRFIDVNPVLLEMLGYTREEALRTTFLGITHPEDRPDTLELSQAVLRGESDGYRQEKRYLTRSGGFIWAVVKATLLRDDAGQPRCWVGTMEDITGRMHAEEERRQMAAQVQQAQKMEAIGTLAGGIAHDFNNLLMGIQGNISILMLHKPEDHPDLSHLKNIEKAVERASDLTRKLLGFARAGKYEMRALDLNTITADAAGLFSRSVKKIRIHSRLPPELWTVEADPNQIGQVVLNLLINAGQAMPGGGELFLETANVDWTGQSDHVPAGAAPGRYVCLTVRDTGVGMDPATRARIFEPFFTTREPGQGTGLGLSAAFGIVKNHKGVITVESEKGRGATFRVFLPAAESRAPVQGPPQAGRRELAGTVLLVEDEEMVADIGGQMLKRLGFAVMTARSGAEAIAMYETHGENIDLVILDMIMPGMDGGQVFDRLRSLNPAVAVLLSSGYSLNGKALEILKRGCRGFIHKPFNLDQLKQKISEVLSPGRGPGG
jgi:PAS domain S-box-containing protein